MTWKTFRYVSRNAQRSKGSFGDVDQGSICEPIMTNRMRIFRLGSYPDRAIARRRRRLSLFSTRKWQFRGDFTFLFTKITNEPLGQRWNPEYLKIKVCWTFFIPNSLHLHCCKTKPQLTWRLIHWRRRNVVRKIFLRTFEEKKKQTRKVRYNL